MPRIPDSNDLLFSGGKNISTNKNTSWKVMNIDDDSVIHDVSHLVLADLTTTQPQKIVFNFTNSVKNEQGKPRSF